MMFKKLALRFHLYVKTVMKDSFMVTAKWTKKISLRTTNRIVLSILLKQETVKPPSRSLKLIYRYWLLNHSLQDNTMKLSGTASGADDTCNLNTPIVKNNKRKGDNKTNTGATKSKRNQYSEHDQTNVLQAQYI